MDRITSSLLQNFVSENNLNLSDTEAFERFCNFCLVSREYYDTFDVEDISCGSGNDIGLDGIAILANGTLVTNEEEIIDLCELNGYLEVTFIFVQAKTSNSFSAADISTFCFGVRDFFSENPALPRNPFVSRMAKIQEIIFQRSAQMTKGKPLCKLYYVTTGTWNDDPHIVGRVNTHISDIKGLRLFKDVSFEPVDADAIQRYYRDTKSKASAEFTFVNKTVLPDINGVTEAYLGVLPAKEYLRLVTDEFGNIRKSLFYDNVRDFQDYNTVNKEIQATLQSRLKDRFAVLNNGITLVVRSLNIIGNKFHIEDYQIVNGCQTSHVLFNEQAQIDDTVFVPIKVIATNDEAVTTEITKATNRQTEIKQEQLNALTGFEKKLEAYYNTFKGKERLYYERRSAQYNGIPNIEKIRIVTRQTQVKVIASMFLDEPHRSVRYYGALLKAVGGRLFLDTHNPISYYTSAYANYKLDYLFRSANFAQGYRSFRYHILMIFRYQISANANIAMPSLSAPNRKIEPYCQKLLDVLNDDEKYVEAFKNAIAIIDQLGGKEIERDLVKTQAFTDDIKKLLNV